MDPAIFPVEDERYTRLMEQVRVFRALPASAELAAALLSLAMEVVERDSDESLRLTGEAEEVSAAAGYRAGAIRAQVAYGMIALAQGDIGAAEARAAAALARAQQAGEPVLQGFAHGLAATVHEATGERGEAVARGLLALDLLADSGETFAKGLVTELIGRCCDDLQEPVTAADYLERAVDYYQESGSPRALARVYNRLAGALCDAEALESAGAQILNAERTIEAFEARHGEAPYRGAMGELWLNRARLLCLRKQWAAAREAAEAGLAATAEGERPWRSLLRLKGEVLMEMRELRAAEEIFRALLKAEQRTTYDEARLHEHLATIYARKGGFEEALAHAERFHALDKVWFQEQHAQQSAMTRSLFETQAARQEAELIAEQNRALEDVVGELQRLHAQVRELSRRDGLTGLYNRRYFDERLPGLFAAARDEAPLAVLMGDLDDFKTVNDRFRHRTGDQVLEKVASILEKIAAKRVGNGGFAVRYGGEEFVLVMPETRVDQAQRIATSFCRQVRTAGWDALAEGLSVTISIGVADSAGLTEGEELTRRADEALYHAKQAGKNRARRFRAWRKGAPQ